MRKDLEQRGLGRLAAACAVGALLLVAAAAPSRAQAAPAIVGFNIRPQPLAGALNEFAVQSGRQILYSPALAQGHRSPGLQGAFAPEAALRHLLVGSGLQFQVSGESFLVRAAPEAAPPPELVEPRSPPAEIQEVVVTATKRATLAQSTPISMTIVAGETLTRLGALDLQSSAPLLPGLKTVSSAFGRRLVLRGIYGAGEPTTGLYYGETPVAGPAGTTSDPGQMAPELLLVDVDRIELLRGPQGTLYGSGSMGGTLRVLFNRPVLSETSLASRVQVGEAAMGGPSAAASATLNLPLAGDQAALRVVAYDQRDGGAIDNVRLGLKNVDATRISGVRVAALWEPETRISLQVSGALQQTHAGDVPVWNPSVGPWRTDHSARSPFDGRIGLLEAVLRWRTDWGSITAVSSLFRWDLTRRTDYANTLLSERTSAAGCNRYYGLGAGTCAAGQMAGYAAFVDSLFPALISQPVDLTSWIDEIRIASRDDVSLRWTVGAFRESRRDEIDSQVIQADPASGSAYVPTRFIGRREVYNELTQTALFGEASYDISQETTLTAGGRWFHYSRHDSGGVSIPNVVSGTSMDYALDASTSDEGWSFKYLASQELRPGVLAYVEASQGFRPGGVNAVPGLPTALTPYRSDSLWNYELGLKSEWFARRLQANLALYRIDWRDMQYSVSTTNRAFSFITNIGASRIYGLEAEVQARPASGWQTALALTYTDARLTADQVTNTAIGVGVKGDRIPVVPRFTAAGSLERTWPLEHSLVASARLDGSYVGEAWSGFNSSAADYLKMGGFALFDFRLGLGRGPWEAQIAVENLLDRAGVAQAARYALTEIDVYGPPPRTISASLSLRF